MTQKDNHHHRRPASFARSGARALTALAVAAAVLAGCGSSKPSYCSAVSNLESSIKAVPNTDVVANGTSALKSALQKVESDAQAVVSAAKSDFPKETSALSDSVTTLSNSVKQLSSSPTPQAVVALAGQATAVVNAGKGLKNATSAKCG